MPLCSLVLTCSGLSNGLNLSQNFETKAGVEEGFPWNNCISLPGSVQEQKYIHSTFLYIHLLLCIFPHVPPFLLKPTPPTYPSPPLPPLFPLLLNSFLFCVLGIKDVSCNNGNIFVVNEDGEVLGLEFMPLKDCLKCLISMSEYHQAAEVRIRVYVRLFLKGIHCCYYQFLFPWPAKITIGKLVESKYTIKLASP